MTLRTPTPYLNREGDATTLFLNGERQQTLEPLDARFILAGICKNRQRKDFKITGGKVQMIRHWGVLIEAIMYHDDYDNIYCFVDIERMMFIHDKATKVLCATLCGNIMHGVTLSEGYGLIDHIHSSEIVFNADNSSVATWFEGLESVRMSQFHHNHVKIHDIQHLFKSKRDLTFLNMLRRYTNIKQTVITFMTYYVNLEHKEKDFLIKILQYNGLITDEWLDYLGTAFKQLHGLYKLKLIKFFELKVLQNRVKEEVDWQDERRKRENPDIVILPQDVVYARCVELFSMAKREGKSPFKISWEDYWAQRLIITPSGSAHSQYEEDSFRFRVKDQSIKNKKLMLAQSENDQLIKWTQRTPMLYATTSVKHEWGKARALYGCDITSHVLADFSMMCCEDTFPSFIPTGSYATIENIRMLSSHMSGCVPLCYDYSDFNSQHSIQSMQEVIQAWLDVYSDMLDEGQIEAIKWTKESAANMHVKNNINGDQYVALGTLFSGWRLTTFVNTALNYAYLAHAGIREKSTYSIHNGDDVLAATITVGDALSVCRKAKEIGVRANLEKMNIGTVSEFLRTDTRCCDTNMNGQYLTRATATYVHSRIESEQPLSMMEALKSHKTRTQEMVNRGGSKEVTSKIYNRQKERLSKRFEISRDVIEFVENTHTIAGGCNPTGEITDVMIKEKRRTRPTDIDKNKLRNSIKSAIDDYATFIGKKIPQLAEQIDKKTIWKNYKNIIRDAVIVPKLVKANRGTLYTRLSLMGAWKGKPGIKILNRFRHGLKNSVFCLQKLDSQLASVLVKTDDPVSWLMVLT